MREKTMHGPARSESAKSEKFRRRRDLIQNLLISLLSVSAVLLFTRTQLYNLDASGTVDSLFSSSVQSTQGDIAAAELSVPVRIVVSGTYGRYGNTALTTADDSYTPLRTLLSEVLGSAGRFSDCTRPEFLSALSESSVFYDFLNPLPLSLVSDLSGIRANDDSPVRRLIVAEQQSGVTLYLWDGADAYRCCTTAVSPENLEEVISRYELGSTRFAADLAGPTGTSPDPMSILPDPLPALPILSPSYSAADHKLLLSALQYNPNTNNRYTESDGTEVILDGDRTLRIQPDGRIDYQGGSDASLTVSADASIRLIDAISGTKALLNALLASQSGNADLYLTDVSAVRSHTVLTFAYQFGGVPICLAGDVPAARVELEENAVLSLTLQLRQYTAAEETSLLLPLTQSMAIAARHPGEELSIGYADNGSAAIPANWMIHR